MLPLRRDPRQPLYAQVEALLLGRIRRDYRPGQLLPTQRRLVEETGASLITVKRALDEIARRGLIEGVRGRGTVVRRPPIADDHRGLSSWTDSIAGLGVVPRTAWVRMETRVPPPEIARLLRLKARERTAVVRRLRTIDGEPVCLMTNEIPLALVPDLPRRGLTEESLYACLLARYRLRPALADEEVTARPSTRLERDLLGRETAIVLVIRRHSRLRGGRPLEAAEIVAPAHRYRYQVQIVSTAPAAALRGRASP